MCGGFRSSMSRFRSREEPRRGRMTRMGDHERDEIQEDKDAHREASPARRSGRWLLRQRRGVVELLARGPEGRKKIAPNRRKIIYCLWQTAAAAFVIIDCGNSIVLVYVDANCFN